MDVRMTDKQPAMDAHQTIPPQKLKGFKIQTFNYVMILIACILYAFLLFKTVQISSRFASLIQAEENHITCEKAASMVIHGSDTLTAEVRLFAVTTDLSHVDAYFEEANVTRQRERGLAELEKQHPDDVTHGYLLSALRYSNALMEREIYAMALTALSCGYELPEELQKVELSERDLALSPAEQFEKAQDMVFNEDYKNAKDLVDNNVNYCLESILRMAGDNRIDSSDALRLTIAQQRVAITLLFIMNVVIFIFVTALIIRPLRIYIQCIGDNKLLQITGSYEFKYLALTYNNIYELNAANEVLLRHQAERDGLTGVLNRGAYDKLRQNMRDYPYPVTLLLIDVDEFKSINDGYGHPVGDQVLKTVAKRLCSSFRSTDAVARLGGDEFSVVMSDAPESLRSVIQQKIDALNQELRAGEDGLPPTSLSVGVAFSHSGFDDGLYDRADQALYVSKNSGRCQCNFYSKDLENP